MSRVATFDTLQFAKKLKEAGFTERQAEVQAEALAEIIDDKIATKQDIHDLEVKMKELEYRMTIKVGSMMVIAVGILIAAMKYII